MRKTQKPCPRIIHPSKYERTHAKNREWWQKVFDILEAEAAVVSIFHFTYTYRILKQIDFQLPHRNPEVLAKIFPWNLLAKILSMISVDERANMVGEVEKGLSKMSISSKLHKLKMDSAESCSISAESQQTFSQTIEGKERFFVLVIVLITWCVEVLQVQIILT